MIGERRLKFRVLALCGLIATLGAGDLSGRSATDASMTKDDNPSLPTVERGYPTDLPLCPIAQNLQHCLDQNQKVRLESGDYRRHTPRPLIVTSGQQLFGLPGSYVPDIRIAAGTQKVVLSAITTATVDFVPSDSNSPTRFNLFIRVTALFNDIGAVVTQNVFTYCNGPLRVDNRSSGYLRNNRFIGSHSHGPSDMIYLLGDTNRTSYGNVFLWYNFLTPHGRTTHIENQLDISFVGIDAETWNEKGEDPTWAPMLDLRHTSVLRLFDASGGNGGSYPTPYIRADAGQVQILDMNSFSRPLPVGSLSAARSPWDPTSATLLNTIFLGADNKLSWIANFCCISSVTSPAGGAHFELFESASGKFAINGIDTQTSVDVADVDHLHELFSPANRPGEPWEEPAFEPLPDPAGPNWRASIATARQNGTDDSARIQNMIDSSPTGIALIPAGTFYIAKPLVLGKDKGLIGAGRDKTVILALSDSLDMIVPGNSAHPNSGGSQTFILSDLTLQGGRTGVFHSADNTGPFTQLHDVFLSYVQFREMKDAGILFRNIYGWDNNFLDHLAFIKCKTGFRQEYPSTPKSGENSDNNYIDKTIFYKNQFIGNKLAVDLSAHRPDNLNAFINSSFKDNAAGAVVLRAAWSTIFAGSQFNDNGGSAVVDISDSRYTSLTGCQFTAGRRGRFFFSQAVNVEGATFSQGAGGTARVFRDAAAGATIYNSLSDVPLGRVLQGVFVNSKFPDPDYDRFFVLDRDGYARITSSDYSHPKGQLLWGSRL